MEKINFISKIFQLMNKMYLYTMRPFNNETLQAFENNFLGLSWDVLSKLYPEIILRPYGSIMLLLEVLKVRQIS